MQKAWNEVAKDLELVKEKGLKFEHNKQFGFFYRISKKEEKCLKNKPNYRSFDVRRDGVKFKDSKLDSLNKQYSEITEAYSQKQQILGRELMQAACM